MHQLNRLHDRKPVEHMHSKNSPSTDPHIQNLCDALTRSYFLYGDRQEAISQEAGMVEIWKHRNFENAVLSANGNTQQPAFQCWLSNGFAVNRT